MYILTLKDGMNVGIS